MATVPPPELDAASVLDPTPAPTSLDASCAGMAMSEVEYAAVDDWDRAYRFELLDGRIVVSPAPNFPARTLVEALSRKLWQYFKAVDDSTLDHTTVAEQDIKTSSGVRRGDRVVWCGLGRTPKLADVPTIAVEIVSKDKRDRHRDFVEKRREYLQAGVREYWIFDPFRRTLTVCTTAEGDAGRKVVKATGTYRTALLPGFELSIAELLAEADAVGG